MKRLILGGVLLASFAVGAYAQQVFPHFGSFTDIVAAPSPCAPHGGLRGPAAPFVYQDSVWHSFTCNDDTVIMRQYASIMAAPPPVYGIVCPAGFVHTGDKKGCVPPDHPSAGR